MLNAAQAVTYMLDLGVAPSSLCDGLTASDVGNGEFDHKLLHEWCETYFLG